MLKDIFTNLVLTYVPEQTISDTLWNEIEKKYSSRKRHYHNLEHLVALINQLNECRNKINDWDVLLFSVFYHDAVYNVLKSDNEERSAELAVQRLLQIQFPFDKINLVREQVLATKSHAISSNADTNFFTDADLSILGQSPAVYEQYCRQIRKEYSIYPDIIYKPGRKKVILHFLEMERIFKTEYFFSKYEMQARENLERESSGF